MRRIDDLYEMRALLLDAQGLRRRHGVLSLLIGTATVLLLASAWVDRGHNGPLFCAYTVINLIVWVSQTRAYIAARWSCQALMPACWDALCTLRSESLEPEVKDWLCAIARSGRPLTVSEAREALVWSRKLLAQRQPVGA